MARLRYFARETLISLRRNLMMTIAGVLTVAVSLALFGGGILLTKWAGHGTESIKGDVRLEIFMRVDATHQQIDDVRQELKQDADVKRFRFLTKQDALAEFKRIFRKDPDLAKNITADALPTSFRIVPQKDQATPLDRLVKSIERHYETFPGVDDAATPGEALRGLQNATDTVRNILIGLSMILLISSLFLIVNTIRLATFARRREIEVMKLVGASNWFVRVPFLAEGLTQGLLGASIAMVVVVSLKQFGFDKWFDDPKSFFYTFFLTGHDALVIAIYVLLAGVFIGLVGSFLGLRRFLRV